MSLKTTIPIARRWKAGANHLLNGIPPAEYEILVPSLHPLHVADSHILYEYGCEILDCYFVSTALISSLQVMQNGDTVEVGLFGAEGFAGHPALLNFTHSTQLVTVQVSGEVIKIDSGVLRRFLPQTPVLEKLLLRFSYLQSLQAQQIAACNGLHEIEQRLAFWILMTQDRVRLETLPLTHDLLAGMLGSRRASVTVAAGVLQKAGLIEYRRGKLQVLQREKLEQAACECYRSMRSQLNSYVQSIDLYRPYVL